jgi:hypothetical protein
VTSAAAPESLLDVARAIVICLTIGLLPAAITHADPGAPTLLEVAAAYGFSEDDVETMLAGKPVLAELEAASGNELALSAIMLTRQPVEWHFERLDRAEAVDLTIEGSSEMVGDGRASLAELVLTDEELDRLAHAEAGEDFNFSTREIEAFRSATKSFEGDAARRIATLAVFRTILMRRYAEYREKGLAGLAPYDRGDGNQTSSIEQLDRAFGELRLTRQLAPHVAAAIEEYPTPPADDVTSRFFWTRNDAEGRPLISLSHRVFGKNGGVAVVIDRRFYVHHTVNSMQAAAAAIPVAEGTVVLYSNRTATDLVTGFGSSIAKKVGRMLMRREIGRLVDSFLDVAE